LPSPVSARHALVRGTLERVRALAAGFALAFILDFCPPITEEGQFRLGDGDFVPDRVSFASGDLVVAGARFCPEVDWTVETEDGRSILPNAWSVIDACFESSVEGPARWAERCLTFEEEGDVTWHLERRPCDIDTRSPKHHVDDLVDDRFRLRVVPVEATAARLDDQAFRWMRRWLSPGPRAPFPDPARPDEPLRVLEGRNAWLRLDLFEGASEQGVAWDHALGRRVFSSPGSIFNEYDSFTGVRLEAGEVFDASIVLGGIERPAPSAIAVPASEAASLEITVGYRPRQDDPERWDAPWMARAITRDGSGRILHGAPVSWSLAGGGLLGRPGTDEDEVGPEYFWFEGACPLEADSPPERSARLEARWDDLSASETIRWVHSPEHEPADPDEVCVDAVFDRGCGCDTRPGPSASWTFLAVLLWMRRRRSPSSRRALAPSRWIARRDQSQVVEIPSTARVTLEASP
jgi:hypothetical protein